jgi:hypothetical protein
VPRVGPLTDSLLPAVIELYVLVSVSLRGLLRVDVCRCLAAVVVCRVVVGLQCPSASGGMSLYLFVNALKCTFQAMRPQSPRAQGRTPSLHHIPVSGSLDPHHPVGTVERLDCPLASTVPTNGQLLDVTRGTPLPSI